MPEISTQDIYYRLGQLEGKIDAFLTRLATHENELNIMDERVRLLEKAKNTAAGYAAAVGAIVALLASLLVKAI